MSGVFQNIDPPPPHRPATVYVPPAFGAGGGHTRWVERGWGINISEDARHSSVLYVSTLCTYHSLLLGTVMMCISFGNNVILAVLQFFLGKYSPVLSDSNLTTKPEKH